MHNLSECARACVREVGLWIITVQTYCMSHSHTLHFLAYFTELCGAEAARIEWVMAGNITLRWIAASQACPTDKSPPPSLWFLSRASWSHVQIRATFFSYCKWNIQLCCLCWYRGGRLKNVHFIWSEQFEFLSVLTKLTHNTRYLFKWLHSSFRDIIYKGMTFTHCAQSLSIAPVSLTELLGQNHVQSCCKVLHEWLTAFLGDLFSLFRKVVNA